MKNDMNEKYPVEYYYGKAGYAGSEAAPLYNPAASKDMDKTPDEKADIINKLVDLMDLHPGEDEDIETSDDLPKDNEHKKAWDAVVKSAKKASKEKSKEVKDRKESKTSIDRAVDFLVG